jgi:hypothetical protein
VLLTLSHIARKFGSEYHISVSDKASLELRDEGYHIGDRELRRFVRVSSRRAARKAKDLPNK